MKSKGEESSSPKWSKDHYAGRRIRTLEGTKPMGPKPIPFDRSGIPALIYLIKILPIKT